MTLNITADQQALYSASFRDANNGEIGPPDKGVLFGPFHPQPFWAEDSKGAIIKLVPNPEDSTSTESATGGAIDGHSCIVEGVAPGTATLTCTDRGTGKSATDTIIVSAGGVASVSISAGGPVRKPVTAPIAEEVHDEHTSDAPPGTPDAPEDFEQEINEP